MPLSMENLIGDLRMVLDPTRPKIFLKSLRPYARAASARATRQAAAEKDSK